jgi:NADH-quinone oxidoreductase subunit L
MSGSGDITIMGGLRKKLPWTHGVFFVCWLAICGFPMFSGFFSKDSIIAGAFATEVFGENLAWVGKAVAVTLLAAALGTAFYMSRLYFLVFSGKETRAPENIKHHIHESPGVMVAPLVLLAVGAAVGGLLGIPGSLFGHPEWNLFGHELEPVLGAELEVPVAIEGAFIAISTAIAVVGIALAWLYYGGGYREPARKFAASFPKLVRLVQDKFRIDELYAALFVRPLRRFAQGLYFLVDRWVIDRVAVEGMGMLIDVFGRIARNFQVGGDGQRYMAVFALGVALLVYFTTHPVVGDLRVTVNGRSVEVDARRSGRPPAQPLEYAFDFDGDGKPEVTGASPEARHVYDRPGKYTIKVSVKDPRWGTTRSREEKVEVR